MLFLRLNILLHLPTSFSADPICEHLKFIWIYADANNCRAQIVTLDHCDCDILSFTVGLVVARVREWHPERETGFCYFLSDMCLRVKDDYVCRPGVPTADENFLWADGAYACKWASSKSLLLLDNFPDRILWGDIRTFDTTQVLSAIISAKDVALITSTTSRRIAPLLLQIWNRVEIFIP